jgi:hypothetical protein
MKRNFFTTLIAAVLVAGSIEPAGAATHVYDLRNDWSDTANPNGQWSYRNWFGDLLSNEEPGWGWIGLYGFDGILRVTGESATPGYFDVGDIIIHSASAVRIRWTAPGSGSVNIAGLVWAGPPYLEEFLPAYDWRLLLNESLLKGGITSGTKESPYYLSNGSSGSSTLQNISVASGDEIDLVFEFGFLEIAANLTITFTSDAADPVAAIENLAVTVVEMNLQNGIENSLDSKLDAALNALNDANVNNDGAACNSLGAFISAVEEQRNKKITSAQADQLIAAAQQIKTSLNCAN